MDREKSKNSQDKKKLKNKVQQMIEKAKKLGLVKPLSTAFENNPVEKEEHKGKIKNYN